MIEVRVAAKEELEWAFAIRRDVFVVEQGIAEELEFDQRDAECTHFLAFDRGAAVATARLRERTTRVHKVERVAVRATARGRGIGALLMDAIERHAGAVGVERLVLSAQESAIAFYARRGYLCEGDAFVEAGIRHRWMSRELGAKSR